MGKKSAFLVTYGCQMNVHDSEKITGLLENEGYCRADEPSDADLIVFNTCSVRQKAEQKFFSEIGTLKNLKRKNPGLKIAVAGCIAQQQGKKIFTRAPHVDYVLGPQNLHLLPSLIKSPSHTAANGDNPLVAETDVPVTRKEGGRAWVTIMYGCDNFCAYCIVPYTRGPEKSRPSENILKEITGLADAGFKEITLLGQNVNSYKSDLSFPELLEKINSVNGISRIRFVTSHPKDLSEDLVTAVRDLDKVCEHIHLPLQSGSDRILTLMCRGYSSAAYLEKIHILRNSIPRISITTDIIAGFPGETEEDHLQTLKALREIEFDGIYAFKYSPRQGTKAAVMEPRVSEAAASRRLSEILETSDAVNQILLKKKYLGTMQEVLVEGFSETNKDMLTGKTRSGRVVNFYGSKDLIGKSTKLKITGTGKNSLRGAYE